MLETGVLEPRDDVAPKPDVIMLLPPTVEATTEVVLAPKLNIADGAAEETFAIEELSVFATAGWGLPLKENVRPLVLVVTDGAEEIELEPAFVTVD